MINLGNFATNSAKRIPRGMFVIASWLALISAIWLVPSQSGGTLVADTIAESSMGDGELAITVPIQNVHALAAGSRGEIYLIDGQGWLREIGTDGRIRTLTRGPVTSVAVEAENGSVYAAGSGVRVFRSTSQDATRSSVELPGAGAADATDIAVAANGALYIVDSTRQLKRLNATTGESLALANTQSASEEVSDNPDTPRVDMIAAGVSGTLYTASRSSTVVRTASAAGAGALPPVPSVVSGISHITVGRDGLLYANAGGVWRYEEYGWRQLTQPAAEFVGTFAVQDDGLILFDRVEQVVVRIHLDGTRQVLTGSGRSGSIGDGGPASKASFLCTAVTVDATGNVLFSDSLNSRVAVIDKSGRIDTYIGSVRRDGVLSEPLGLDVATDGTVYVADGDRHRVYRRTSKGNVEVFAGNGEEGFGGDGGPARSAMLRAPSDVRSDSNGGLYILDSHNMRVRHVDRDGVIRTVARIDPGPRHEWEWPSKLLRTAPGQLYVTTEDPPALLQLDRSATRKSQLAAPFTPLSTGSTAPSDITVVEMVGSALLMADASESARGIFSDSLLRHRIDRTALIGDSHVELTPVGALDETGNIVVCDRERIVRLRKGQMQ